MTSTQPFLWGVATSGSQSEGGYNGPEQPQNNWSQAEKTGEVMTTGAASEFWQRYEDDFKTCKEMGLNAFRMGLEWPRIQPTTDRETGPAPVFDRAVIDAYADRIAACRRQGLEPIVTLQHFTHPAWLGVDAWLEERTVDAYADYVQVTVTQLNRRLVEVHELPPIHWYITLNEPNILVNNTYLNDQFPSAVEGGLDKIFRAYSHLLAAHVCAYNLIHDTYEAQGWPKPKVSLNTYCSDLYWSDQLIWDLLLSRQLGIERADLADYVYHKAQRLENALGKANFRFKRDLPFRLGQAVRWVANQVGHRTFKAEKLETFFEVLEGSVRSQVVDYLAFDYYDPFLAHTFRFPVFSDFEFQTKGLRSWLMSGMMSKWWDWRSLPDGLYFFSQYYAQAFPDLPILIAENGMALRRKPDNSIASPRQDQLCRSDFLQAHLEQVQKLRDAEIPLVGYMHWSLTDNYEWGSYTPRFGLFSIDFNQGAERHRVDPLGDCPSETYASFIRQHQEAQGVRGLSSNEY
ncbi:MAG: family 1 glycosylhydrolase [Thermosynechococcaceae cyanobacterium]